MGLHAQDAHTQRNPQNTKCRYVVSLNTRDRELPKGQTSQMLEKKHQSPGSVSWDGSVGIGEVHKGWQFVMENAQVHPGLKDAAGHLPIFYSLQGL